jgi:hypothetical protein
MVRATFPMSASGDASLIFAVLNSSSGVCRLLPSPAAGKNALEPLYWRSESGSRTCHPTPPENHAEALDKALWFVRATETMGDAQAPEPPTCRFDPRTMGAAGDNLLAFTTKTIEPPTVSVALSAEAYETPYAKKNGETQPCAQ